MQSPSFLACRITGINIMHVTVHAVGLKQFNNIAGLSTHHSYRLSSIHCFSTKASPIIKYIQCRSTYTYIYLLISKYPSRLFCQETKDNASQAHFMSPRHIINLVKNSSVSLMAYIPISKCLFLCLCLQNAFSEVQIMMPHVFSCESRCQMAWK